MSMPSKRAPRVALPVHSPDQAQSRSADVPHRAGVPDPQAGLGTPVGGARARPAHVAQRRGRGSENGARGSARSGVLASASTPKSREAAHAHAADAQAVGPACLDARLELRSGRGSWCRGSACRAPTPHTSIAAPSIVRARSRDVDHEPAHQPAAAARVAAHAQPGAQHRAALAGGVDRAAVGVEEGPPAARSARCASTIAVRPPAVQRGVQRPCSRPGSRCAARGSGRAAAGGRRLGARGPEVAAPSPAARLRARAGRRTRQRATTAQQATTPRTATFTASRPRSTAASCRGARRAGRRAARPPAAFVPGREDDLGGAAGAEAGHRERAIAEERPVPPARRPAGRHSMTAWPARRVTWQPSEPSSRRSVSPTLSTYCGAPAGGSSPDSQGHARCREGRERSGGAWVGRPSALVASARAAATAAASGSLLMGGAFPPEVRPTNVRMRENGLDCAHGQCRGSSTLEAGRRSQSRGGVHGRRGPTTDDPAAAVRGEIVEYDAHGRPRRRTRFFLDERDLPWLPGQRARLPAVGSHRR